MFDDIKSLHSFIKSSKLTHLFAEIKGWKKEIYVYEIIFSIMLFKDGTILVTEQ